MLKIVFVLPIAMLSACATLVNGTSQTITVSTIPPAASCTLERVGARVGAISSTPGSVRLDKSKNDLSVTCSKDGFQAATIVKTPSFGGATFGNLVAGGLVGAVVDAASGANYSYPDDIRLEMAANPLLTLPPMALAPSVTPGTAMLSTVAATQFDRPPAQALATRISATTVRTVSEFPR